LSASAHAASSFGGAVEGDAIAVQGDQRERVRKWLEAKGVGKVTVAG
jgi:translation initiation factor 1 (eIF-1/SUI1)